MSTYERTDKDWDKHFTLLGTLYIGFGCMGVLAAVITFIIIAGAGLLSGDTIAIGITSTVATIIATIILIVCAPGIFVGIGILKRWDWIRVPMLVIGIMNLPAIPFGTIIGIYTLWLFQNTDIDSYLTSTGQTA
jgi:hypothetical protein